MKNCFFTVKSGHFQVRTWGYFNNSYLLLWLLECISPGKLSLKDEHSFFPVVVWINDVLWVAQTGVCFYNLNFPEWGITDNQPSQNNKLLWLYTTVSLISMGIGSHSFISDYLQTPLKVIIRCCVSSGIILFLTETRTRD